jgi:thiopeptide-type bacteriocin biosynthesis protein
MDTALQKRLGDKFRKHGKELASLLAASADDPDHDYAPGLVAFAARSQRLRPLAQRLRTLASAGALTQSIETLVHSYVHMHVNRMIRSSQRAHELVLYDLLRRHYDGLVARGKQQHRKTA